MEAKQAAWRAASAEASGVGVGGEVSCLASGGGKAVSGEIIVADYERG